VIVVVLPTNVTVLVATVKVVVLGEAVRVVIIGETGYLEEQKDWAGPYAWRGEASAAYTPPGQAFCVCAVLRVTNEMLHSSETSDNCILSYF